jgi:hypothetical protein
MKSPEYQSARARKNKNWVQDWLCEGQAAAWALAKLLHRYGRDLPVIGELVIVLGRKVDWWLET